MMIWDMGRIKLAIDISAGIIYNIIIPIAIILTTLCLFSIYKMITKKYGSLVKSISNYMMDNPGIFIYGVITMLLFGIMLGIPSQNRNNVNCIIAIMIWGITTILIAISLLRKHQDTQYWIKFHETYGKPYAKISVPMSFYGDFEAHFWLYDEDGNVKDSAKTQSEAIMKHKETGLYITRIIEKYPVEE